AVICDYLLVARHRVKPAVWSKRLAVALFRISKKQFALPIQANLVTFAFEDIVEEDLASVIDRGPFCELVPLADQLPCFVWNQDVVERWVLGGAGFHRR